LFQVGFDELETCFNISAKLSSFFSLFEEEEVEHLFPSFQDEESHTLSMFCPNLLNFQRSREHSILSVEKSLHFQYMAQICYNYEEVESICWPWILCLDSL